MTEVVVVVGAGAIGQAIARRVGAGRHVLLADRHQSSADASAELFRDAGFEASAAEVDVTDRASVVALASRAAHLGPVTRMVHAAGVSPSQAPPAVIVAVDLYGTALVLEEFGRVIAEGGSGLVVASQSGHVLPAFTAEQERQLATTPADDLLALPMLQPSEVPDSLYGVPAVQACERSSGSRGGRAVGRAWRARQRRQSGRDRHPDVARRAQQPRRSGVPGDDRDQPRRSGRYPGRGRDGRGAPPRTGRRVHHRQRRPHRRRPDRVVLLRGWGRASSSRCVVVLPRLADDLVVRPFLRVADRVADVSASSFSGCPRHLRDRNTTHDDPGRPSRPARPHSLGLPAYPPDHHDRPPPSRPEAKPSVSCPACGLPATVESRDMVAGTSGPVTHLQLRCPAGRHWFRVPEDGTL